MKLLKKFNSKRGFTLAELVIVVAIIAILAGIAVTFINPKDISYVENNRSAEAIATAVQNRLTEIRNSGNMEILRRMGEQYVSATEAVKAEVPSGDGSGDTPGDTSKDLGGYRYVFNYNESGGAIERNSLISYILPFGAIDYDLAQNYYAIGFQSDTGMVGEVFYSTKPFVGHSASYLLTISGDSEQAKQKRKAENVGYYQGTTYEEEVAFANLPTPQLTITNYETLTLSIYLPEVKQLEESGKNLGILVSLSDKNGEAYKKGLTVFQTAIYSTFSSANIVGEADGTPQPVVKNQNISSGGTYKIILDTVQECDEGLMKQDFKAVPKGKFEQWATKSGAFKDGYFELGDNNEITVTVYCMDGKFPEGVTSDETVKIDPTYLPRSASLIFNGWFNNYNDSTVEIACGRHLQNLGKLTQLRSKLQKYLPAAAKEGDSYTYGDYNYGMANVYTDGTDNDDPKVGYSDITEKYEYRDHVKHISKAKQVNAIDFDCAEWKWEGKQIPFTPVCLPSGFYYYGNYLTINHLYVNSPFYAGLFGYLYHPRLYDILLVNPSVTSQMPEHLSTLYEMGVGALIGTSRDSSHINNCQVYMTPDNADGKYNPDYRVQGQGYVGGLIGFCEDEHIENCSASVYTGYRETDTLSSRYVGGLVGAITGDSKIKNCYAAGNLSGDYVGGLVGYIFEDSDPSGDDYRIETCYTAGHIEYAKVQASGLLGLVSELSGNARSALSAFGNYCVVIYGQKDSAGKYAWHGSAPIYGTFNGDNFEWLRTSDFNGYSDTYLKGKYGTYTDEDGNSHDGHTFFAGAVFKNDNKNYYIAQKDITYAGSTYFTAMKEVAEQFIEEAKGKTDKTELAKIAQKYEQKLKWLKKLQTLDDLKTLMERLIYEVDHETGTDKDGRPYNYGGYYTDTSGNIYLDLDRARIDDYDDVKNHNYIKVTLVQALHAIYDGTYTEVITDKEGNTTTQTKTVTIEYKGNDVNKPNFNSIGNHTFMSYYNELQKQYKILAENPDNAEAKERLKVLLGDNSREIYKKQTKKKEDDGTITITKEEKKRFYEGGIFYQSFESELLYRLFDKAKDFYQTDKKDKTGELIYRHFRSDYIESGFVKLLCDLAMSDEGRAKMLTDAKMSELDSALTMLETYDSIAGKWKGDMKSFTTEAQGLISKAKTAVETLKKDVASSSTLLSTLEAHIKAADDAFVAMYNFYESHKNAKDVSVDSDFKEDASGTRDMRNLRDYTSQLRRSVQLCASTSESGAIAELEILAARLEDLSPDVTDLSDKVTALRDECIKNIQTIINNDSGHRLKNATELRNAVRGYVNGDDSGGETTRDKETLGFMYDYQNEHSGNPYKFTNDAYVDKDNGIYNNVFPYNESEHTSYYPFPFVYGRDVENGKRVLYVLFHYGDWLTEDLWAAPTITYHTDYPTMEGFSGEDIELSQYRVTNVNSFAPDEDIITSKDEDIEIPFYFEGWYVDEDKTIPYSEEFKKSIEAAAINGEEKNFDLYAKWMVKPSLTFYAADLEGSYNGRAIPIDTTMTLKSDDKSLKSENANSYRRFTAWLNPGQEVSLDVSGHYNYRDIHEDSGPVLSGQGEDYYIIDRLKVVESTLTTGAAWYGEENIDRNSGTVTFTVPLGATDSDKYEITLSADGEEGQPEFNICVAEGTMIRMGDGSTKAVEDLKVGDIVLAFNHLTVKYEPTAVWMMPHTDVESKLYRVITLNFSDGSSLKIVGEHGLFDRTLNKYVFINESNYNEYIGHKFSAVTASSSGFGGREVTLVKASVSYEMTKIYSPITENYLNIVAEDLLTVTSMMGYGDAVMNIFDYEPDMSYDKIQMAADINKYGVYSYEDFADMLPQEVYAKVPLKVMKVAVGKGLISYEEVKQIIEYIYKNGYLS